MNANDTWIKKCRGYLLHKYDVDVGMEHAYDILNACFESYNRYLDEWCLHQHIDSHLEEIINN